MCAKQVTKKPGDPVGTTGHSWDGIEELNNPLPRWWIITWVLTILFSIGYMVVYPAWPLISKGTEGIWGWTSRGQLANETKAAEAARATTLAALAATPIEQIPNDPKLLAAAKAGGKAAFLVNCVQCHGSGAAGSIGYPNLNDDDWLWGGKVKDIEFTLLHGIRQPGHDATRTSLMPSFGKDGILTPAQITDTASYVLSLSGKHPSDAAAQRGAANFAANCVACHGTDGKGLRAFGAPNLTDAVWLYGGKMEQVTASIHKAHAGVMPAWSKKLDAVTIKMLAAYVYSLGGGEETVSAPATPASGTGNAQP